MLTAVTLLAVTVLAAAGCRTMLLYPLYVLRGMNVDPEFEGLKGKKVAVVCRPRVELNYRVCSVDRELAREVARLLQLNGRKIEVISHRKLDDWLDKNGGPTELADPADFAQLGRQVGADTVLAIDLLDFSHFKSQSMYQGRANVALNVYDCAKPDLPLFTKELPQSLYPPNVGIPTDERREAFFLREYVQVLAGQIGRHFYAHEPHADYAMDARALK